MRLWLICLLIPVVANGGVVVNNPLGGGPGSSVTVTGNFGALILTNDARTYFLTGNGTLSSATLTNPTFIGAVHMDIIDSLNQLYFFNGSRVYEDSGDLHLSSLTGSLFLDTGPNLSGNRAVNMGAPVSGTDAANKNYVDAITNGLANLSGGAGTNVVIFSTLTILNKFGFGYTYLTNALGVPLTGIPTLGTNSILLFDCPISITVTALGTFAGNTSSNFYGIGNDSTNLVTLYSGSNSFWFSDCNCPSIIMSNKGEFVGFQQVQGKVGTNALSVLWHYIPGLKPSASLGSLELSTNVLLVTDELSYVTNYAPTFTSISTASIIFKTNFLLAADYTPLAYTVGVISNRVISQIWSSYTGDHAGGTVSSRVDIIYFK